MSNSIPVNSTTTLLWQTGSNASTMISVPGITDVTIPGPSKKTVDTTDMSNVGYTSNRPANLATLGSVSATLFWNPSNAVHAGLQARLTSGSLVDVWQVQFNTGNTATFSGSVSEIQVKASDPAGGLLKADLKIAATSTFVVT